MKLTTALTLTCLMIFAANTTFAADIAADFDINNNPSPSGWSYGATNYGGDVNSVDSTSFSVYPEAGQVIAFTGRNCYNGGGVDGGAGALSSVIPNLQAVFSDFAATVDKLVQPKFHVTLDPTNVNVNFNGASFLDGMKEDIKKELLDEVGEQIKKAKPNTSGDLKTGTTVLGS